MDMTQQTHSQTGLPDPDYEAEFYRDVPTKRLIAWVIDVIVISLTTTVLTVFSLFTALFFLPALYTVVSFLYRWATLAGGSATLGMRLVALELRRPDGRRFDGMTAFLHTTGYLVSVITFPLQLISIVMILMTARHQSLTDAVLGTAALNKSAR